MGQQGRLSISVERGMFLAEPELEEKDCIRFVVSEVGEEAREYTALVQPKSNASGHWARFIKTPYYMEAPGA